MIRRIPNKLTEASVIPQVRDHARAINMLIDALKASQLKESANAFVETTANGVTVRVKGGSGSSSDTSSARWL